jgi:membrane-associated phospholipid phosphatase
MQSTTTPQPAKSPRPTGRHLAYEVWLVWLGGWRRLWPRFWIILAAVVIGAMAVKLVGPQDNALLEKIRQVDNPPVQHTAEFLTRWGDLTFSGPLSLVLWLIGAVGNRVRWRRFGLALLMAGLLAGLIVNIFRIGTGRPRPYYPKEHPEVTDQFYGPMPWKSGYQSFPSGHACISATTGSTLAAISPMLAIPGVTYAAAVSWSRMQLDRHHPIDVSVGATIGIVTACCFLSTVPGTRIKLRRKRSAKSS